MEEVTHVESPQSFPNHPPKRGMISLLFGCICILVIGVSVGFGIATLGQLKTTQQKDTSRQHDSIDRSTQTQTQEYLGAVSLSSLPLGDNRSVTSPKKGYVYLCRTQNDTAVGGAFQAGPWINQSTKTWDMTRKVTVDGEVKWPNATWQITNDEQTRQLVGNGLPSHTTGVYPINPSDDAYQYDRNPNSVQAQSLSLQLPTNPTERATPDCVGGEVGIMLSGIPLFNAFDAGGRDAMAWEVQDTCSGHPQVQGMYHYHGPSACLKDNSGNKEHADLVGYAMDGFGIYGLKGEEGIELQTDDLDECHGHTHAIVWDGTKKVMYHYHMTHDFPYSVSCFRGQKSVQGPLGGGGGRSGETNTNNKMSQPPMQGGRMPPAMPPPGMYQ
jgi:hypothetical protein